MDVLEEVSSSPHRPFSQAARPVRDTSSALAHARRHMLVFLSPANAQQVYPARRARRGGDRKTPAAYPHSPPDSTTQYYTLNKFYFLRRVDSVREYIASSAVIASGESR